MSTKNILERRTSSPPKMILALVVLVLLSTFFSACTTQYGGGTGAGNIPQASIPSVLDGDNVTTVLLDGTVVSNWTNQTTSVINIGSSSEVSVWENCTGALNISLVTLQYSMDQVLWINSSTTLPQCFNNFSKTDLADKNTGYARFIVKGNASIITNESKFNLSVAYPGFRLVLGTR